MHIHILGICGTFMAGIAILSKARGHSVEGSDVHYYPPMSTQLESEGIVFHEGYNPNHLIPHPDLVVIGNAMSRGNPVVEYVLNENLPFISGPEFLAKYVLEDKHVLAVAGTHGKTTTSSMVAWILEHAGLNPGFLIGGIPRNFGCSARFGDSHYFVLEADEYDTAFYDKRPKFMHFHPKTLVINQVEFDHADIYDNLEQIKRQFHFLIRTVPGRGKLFVPANEENIEDIISRGMWSQLEKYGLNIGDWQAKHIARDGSKFAVFHHDKEVGKLKWSLLGEHNVSNALAAIAACVSLGVDVQTACVALAQFQSVKRRLEIRGIKNGITIYDDFAHHPTSITKTLAGLRAKIGDQRLIVITEMASYTMRRGFHIKTLPLAFTQADYVCLLKPEADNWDVSDMAQQFSVPVKIFTGVDQIVDHMKAYAKSGDYICVMSNRDFGGIHEKLLSAFTGVIA